MVLIVPAGKPSRFLQSFELDMLMSCSWLYVYCVGVFIMLFNDWDFLWLVVGFGVGEMMIMLGLHMGEVEGWYLGG